jgi:hypothetical protein
MRVAQEITGSRPKMHDYDKGDGTDVANGKVPSHADF